MAITPNISPHPTRGLPLNQALDPVHLLRPVHLRGMPDGEEDGGLRKAMNKHMQQSAEGRDGAAQSEGKGRNAHMFYG